MIILLGIPGSGKSTQAELLVKKGFKWLSTGEIMRQKATPEQRDQMLQGKLTDSSEVIELLGNELKNIGDDDRLILDGFPRYVNQAEWILSQSRNGKLKVAAVIYLYVDQKVVQKRMLLRGRMDDSIDAISKRFEEFKRTSLPAISTLEAGGIPILKINANQTPEKIHEDIIKELDSINTEG